MLVELGLEGKLTTGQLKKKWENLKKKYKVMIMNAIENRKQTPLALTQDVLSSIWITLEHRF